MIHKTNQRWQHSPTEVSDLTGEAASPETAEALGPTEVTEEDVEEVTEEVVEVPKQHPEDPGTHPTHQKPVVNDIIAMVRKLGFV